VQKPQAKPEQSKMTTIKAGKLSDRFAFDDRADVSDGAGNFEASWTQKHGPCAAGVIDLTGGEGVLASRLQGVKPVIVTIRDCVSARAITTNWRARDARYGTVYNIRDIMPPRQKGFIDLLCESGVAHG
jgi:head-tail adaptor